MKFAEALEKWWFVRSKATNQSPITLRGIYYLLRRQVGPKGMPKTKSGFYSVLKRVEEQTKISREKLGIITEPKINLITRTGETPILKANLNELQNACAIIYIEKSSIIEAIEEDKSLTDRGIFIIKGMGFSSKEANKIIKKAQGLGIPIFTLTDFDPSGILIDLKIGQCGVKTVRLGIDPELVKALGLKLDDVREALPRAKNQLAHLKYLQINYPKLARGFLDIGLRGQPYRIEIDSIFALAGKDKFLKVILERAEKVIPPEQLQKSIRLPSVPKKIDSLLNEINQESAKLFSDEVSNLKTNIKPKSLSNVKLDKIESELAENLHGNAENETLKILQDTIEKLRELKTKS